MRWLMWSVVLTVHAAADEHAVADELARVDSVNRSPFVTLDTLDGITRAGADVSALNHGDNNVVLRAYSLHGHVVEPSTGLGGYARLRWFELIDNNFYHPDGAGSDTSASGRNSTTLGLMAASTLVSGRLALITHLGFTLGVGANEREFPFSNASIASTLVRPLDFYAGLPRYTTADVGGSLLWRRDSRVVGRVDAGVHLVADCEGLGYSTICDGVGHGFHVNAAIGFPTSIGVTIGLELSTMWIDIDTIGVAADQALWPLHFEHTAADGVATAAATARYRFKYAHAYAALTSAARKYQSSIVNNGVTIGIEGSL